MVQGVVVPSRNKGANLEARLVQISVERPSNEGGCPLLGDKELLKKDRVVGDSEGPGRPRLRGEALKELGPVRRQDVRGVSLGGYRNITIGSMENCVKSVDEDYSIDWRASRREQKGVIPSGSLAADGTGGESAESVRLDPFRLRAFDSLTLPHFQFHSLLE